MAEGCVPSHTICAPGDQAVDPHEEGHGPIRAHAPVVMDIFPRSERTGYFGDLTRTVVRGRRAGAPHEVYAIVHEGVRLGHARIRPGGRATTSTRRSRRSSSAQGYRPACAPGGCRASSTAPATAWACRSTSRRPSRSGLVGLRAGHVVTVEPGCTTWAGGVRIEDVALVTKTGSRNLTRAPKVLEI
jgi:Xaa-Pro aminopeptidase